MFATRTSAAPTLLALCLLLASCENQTRTDKSLTAPLAPSLVTTTSGVINVPADYSAIQAAIDAAVAGDVIVVASGTYSETIDFSGKAITVRSSAGAFLTIIDGDSSSSSVVTAVSGEGPTTVLEGFTITGGNALEGGGMLNVGSSPTVRDCIFSGNNASSRGGGMYNGAGSPTIIRVHFELNSATEMGGGVFNFEASPTISESRFTQNTSNKGGGMRNYLNSHPTVTKCVFEDNHAVEEGGGMDNRKNSNPIVTNCLFVGNTASSGGAMHNYVGRATATGNPTLINVLMVGNSASEGGGMRNNDPSPLILNSVIAFNTGSGISSRNGSAPVIHNTIVWGNTAGSFSGKRLNTWIVTYSDIEGGFPGIENRNVDPMFVDPAGYNLHLQPASTLIDAGGFHALLPLTDYDGNPRIMGTAVDMGPYEFGGVSGGNLPPIASFATPSCTGLTCDFIDTSTDFDGSVVSWSWDFGDGVTSTAQNPSHTYAADGTYPVTLTVSDDDGDSDAVTRNTTVSATTEALTVSAMSPDTAAVPSTFIATISGTGFGADAQVGFSGGKGPAPEVTSVSVVSSTTITATITISSGGPRRPRIWDVVVTSGGSSATLPGALTVLP
ncbi:MAG: PKD domain-containing protein [Candidatus Krumholzibacteria bacterium]